MNNIMKDTETRMHKGIDAFKQAIAKVRTGRAHPSLLDQIRVDYYNNETPLSQVASISVSDARTLAITPYEKRMIPIIEKAIRSSDLGLNPATSTDVIRVPLPVLTEQRRKELSKVVRTEAENARVSIRNVRRDANTAIKEMLKNKEINEDDERRMADGIQKLTDKFIADIDHLLTAKEAELMAI